MPWIDRRPVALEVAVAEAARVLGASRLPVIAGLGTDIAGARAAIALAQRLGGVIDHMHSEALLRDVAVMRDAGMMVTNASVARLRADTVLAVGPALFARPELMNSLCQPPTAPESGGAARRLFALAAARERKSAPADIQFIGRSSDDLPAMLAALRARVAGRPAARTAYGRALDRLAADLQNAKFGVAVWSAAELDPLAIEMLCSLVDELNTRTRFTGLPLGPGNDAIGVLQACGWITGVPVRTGFGRGRPEHDPWRFDAARLVASREADCVVWISAYGDAAPDWDIPMIVLGRTGGPTAHVHIEVGRPGIDHAAVEHLAATDTLVYREASEPRDAPSVAQALARISSALAEAPPC